MHSAMQMLQPDEGHALSSDRKKDLSCQWNPKLHGMKTAGSAREAHVLLDPSLHHLVTVSGLAQFALCNRFLLYLSDWVDTAGHHTPPPFFGKAN